MQYSTFYAKLTPNGGVTGTKFSIGLSGITGVVGGQQTYNGSPLYFSVKPKSSGRATVTFKNDNTGDVIGTRQILIRSTSLAKATHALSVSANSVNEGGTVTFTLDTSDVPVNSTFAYSVTGISAADLASGTLTGNFKVTQDGTAKVSFKLKEDELTEGTETMTLSIASLNLSKAVTINDTSKTPTYVINWHGDAQGTSTILTNVPEGGAPYIVIKTTNVPDGTVFDFEVSGTGVNPADFQNAPLLGQITVTNGLGYHIYRSTRDRLTEGDEIVTATVKRNGVVVGTPKFTLVDDSKGTTYNIGIYDSPTSTTEITNVTEATGVGYTFNSGASSSYGLVGINTVSTTFNTGDAKVPLNIYGSVVVDDLYINGIKIDIVRIVNYTAGAGYGDYFAYILIETNTSLTGLGSVTVKITNVNTGAVIINRSGSVINTSPLSINVRGVQSTPMDIPSGVPLKLEIITA